MSPRRAEAVGDGRDLRDHLVETATRLIARRGTAGLTVREIAREARVATGVLYNHFTDKEELLALGLHGHVKAVERGLPPLPADDEAVDVALVAYTKRALDLHREIVPAFVNLAPAVLERFVGLGNPAAGGQGLRDQLAAYLKRRLAAGEIAPGAPVEAAATMIIGACHEVTLRGPGAVPEGFAEDLAAIVLTGIRVR
ncbi:TetR/AcrR family transcriptional regulator [Herbidospora mongoliensis]|uniref:TetR/AcrR family transcriptional regulator n=1 Tax=Herbidospora mongoliensis TaxID=688067 RepID=UPI000836EA32|nr:TetR/AcrR family transcriptional regulator [Herbidospora mongoliensis]